MQSFLRKAEKWAVKQSDILIADSIGIQDFLSEKYGVESSFIPYGAELFSKPDETVLKEFGLESSGVGKPTDLLGCRPECRPRI